MTEHDDDFVEGVVLQPRDISDEQLARRVWEGPSAPLRVLQGP
jgi:hypothetical protein